MLLHRRLIADLLDALAGEKYPLGTGKLLQVEELLKTLPPDTPPEALRTLLAPLFSTTPQEQAHFYELFERHLALAQAALEEEPDLPENPTVRQAARAEKRWRGLALAALAAVVALAAFVFDKATPPTWLLPALALPAAAFAAWKMLPRRRQFYAFMAALMLAVLGGYGLKQGLTKQIVEEIPQYSSTRNDRFALAPLQTISRNIQPLGDTAQLRRFHFSYKPSDAIDFLKLDSLNGALSKSVTRSGSRFLVDTSGVFTYTAGADAQPGDSDTVGIIAFYDTRIDTVFFIADIIAAPEDTSLIAAVELPHPHELPEIDPADQARADFFRRYQWPMKVLLWAVFALAAWALLTWYERRRARFVAEIEQRDKPPYIWQIETGERPDIRFDEGLALLLNRLRRREGAPTRRLAVPPTIRATARNAGRAAFVYQRQTRPPEYLLLIDRYDANDHRARLFDALYLEMLRAEVIVDRYFYQGDPRVCFNEAHPDGLPIGELLHRHRDARLLLLGEGRRLLMPSTGELAPWTRLFEGWRRRALLLTNPTAQWGRRENTLGSLFHLATASLQGLDLALEQFETLEQRPAADILRRTGDAVAEPIAFEGSLMSTLRRYYPEPLIQWIAACAVYPALHWDLTLFLGRELQGDDDNPLLSAANLRQLSRLPWFVEGRMPEAARLQLVEYLSAQGLEIPVRQALDRLLRQGPQPPEGSVAYDDYRMNVILNELLLNPAPERRRQLEREFEQYLAAGKAPDFVSFKLLQRQPTALDLLAPKSWKKYLFRHGLARLGLRRWTRLAPLWLLLALGIALTPVKTDVCSGGETVTYEDKTLCLDSPQDRLIYLEFLTRDAIERQDHRAADSLRYAASQAARKVAPPADTVPYYQNVSAYYFNYGARAYNDSRTANAIDPDSLRASACDNFRRGSALYTAVSDGVGYHFYTAMRKACPETETDTIRPTDITPPQQRTENREQRTENGQPTTDNPQPTTDTPRPSMVLITGGTFEMGDIMGDNEYDDEKLHTVTLSSFYLGAYEVTFEEFDRFCEATGKENPADREWGRGKRPVINVSWYDVVAYCNWLSRQHGFKPVYTIDGENVSADWSADGYRLPTEAEWEYAARATGGGQGGGAKGGGKVRFGNGKDIADPKEINFDGSVDYKKPYSVVGEYREKTTPVGNFSPNSLGLYDMSGNVYEWCWDWYDDYPTSSQTDPIGADSGSYRVYRGGSWFDYPVYARCAVRSLVTPDYRGYGLGFRLARAAR
jgi:formylglycine-generating enzyme required for sulfatase activity